MELMNAEKYEEQSNNWDAYYDYASQMPNHDDLKEPSEFKQTQNDAEICCTRIC
jgi:hypothetical protein